MNAAAREFVERVSKQPKGQKSTKGYNRKFIESLGVAWPPKKGWKSKLLKEAGKLPGKKKKAKSVKKPKRKRAVSKYTKESKAKYRKKHGAINAKRLKKIYIQNGYPPEWTPELRRKIRKRDNGVCRICGKTNQEEWKSDSGFPALHIHHIDKDKGNCNDSNLITLCSECHSKIAHGKGCMEPDIFREILAKGVTPSVAIAIEHAMGTNELYYEQRLSANIEKTFGALPTG